MLLDTLKEIRQNDGEAKVILFVQFDDLKLKVASALADCGVPTIQLKGGTSQRGRIISDWQDNSGSQSFVLLLSLTQSAAGANLTAANHVMFLHPMLAPTVEQAVQYETQAIGRARRFGQTRSVVHAWRFVTVDTVEQEMTGWHTSQLSKLRAPGGRSSGSDLVGRSQSTASSSAAPRGSNARAPPELGGLPVHNLDLLLGHLDADPDEDSDSACDDSDPGHFGASSSESSS